MIYKSYIIFFLSSIFTIIKASENEDDGNGLEKFRIEGKVVRPDSSLASAHEWFGNTHVFTNTGHVGFLKEDGSFVINNVPWGSHVVQVMNPTFHFESSRVDISSKGKMRARLVNHVQPSKVDLMPYPLRLKSMGPMKYYQEREQWRLTDFLFNPMVLMTVLPLAFMMILPRLGDAETRKDMEQIQLPKMETPELSQIMTSLFGGGASTQPKAKLKPSRRKEK